jgi:hypothetical protein
MWRLKSRAVKVSVNSQNTVSNSSGYWHVLACLHCMNWKNGLEPMIHSITIGAQNTMCRPQYCNIDIAAWILRHRYCGIAFDNVFDSIWNRIFWPKITGSIPLVQQEFRFKIGVSCTRG